MEKVVVVGCGAYMDSGHGCPGEWRCLKAAALGEGTFENPSQVVGFVKCECPGRSLAPNTGLTIKLAEMMQARSWGLSSIMACLKIMECSFVTNQGD